MPFFEALPPEPEPNEPEQASWSPPLWDRPSEAELGAPVPIAALLAKTERFALVLNDVHAYSNGFAFDLVIRGNPMTITEQGLGLWGGARRHRGPRLGLAFADGSHTAGGMIGTGGMIGARTFGATGRDEQGIPTAPILHPSGGGGSNHHYALRYWSFPLPPAGPIQVYVQWLDEAIAETMTVVDGNAIRAAVEHSTILWEP